MGATSLKFDESLNAFQVVKPDGTTEMLGNRPDEQPSIASHFPHQAQPNYMMEHLDKALVMAVEYNVSSIQPALYYAVATHPSMDTTRLPADIHDTSVALYDHLVSSFTPILFTPAPAKHMPCTDAVAHHWMEYVIEPSLSNGGGGRPLETLERMRGLNWEEIGVCDSCCEHLRDEWGDDGEMGSVRRSVEEFIKSRTRV